MCLLYASCTMTSILLFHMFLSHVSYLLPSSVASALAVNLTTRCMAFPHSTTAGPRHAGFIHQLTCIFSSFYKCSTYPLVADAEFFKTLEQSGWLPSASGVEHAPSKFARMRDNANILNHRPIGCCGVPLPLMHDAFGDFVDIFNKGTPTHSDCTFAIDLCQVASEVNSDSLCPFIGFHTLADALSKLLVHATRHPDSLCSCLGMDK